MEETLAGRGDLLTQAAIATAVFGRRDDFDPIVDPIVRIQAGRLRRSLERYYLLSGRQDVLRVELSKGTYVPTFRASIPATEEDPPPAAALPEVAGGGWPAVVLGEFEVAGASPELKAVAARMGDELALEIGRYVAVHVVRQRAGDIAPALGDGARYGFGARVDAEGEGLRVTAHLTDRRTGHEVWGDEYLTAPRPNRWSGSLEDVARIIAARVAAEEGVVVQLQAAERRKRGTPPASPFEAYLVSCEALFARDPATFAAALSALHRVVKEDPDCGWAWTRLSRLCLANHTFEVTDIPTTIEEAVTYAQFGVRADPSRRARCVLASALLVSGELEAARAELDQVLRTGSDSLVYLEIVGYLLIFLGDFDRGRAVCLSALERNPHCLPQVQIGLWLDHLRRGEIEDAYRAALNHSDPTFFIRSSMRACCLGLLGRTEDGRLEAARLLAMKPDFEARGRWLLGRYIKFPEVMDRIAEGLARVGLRLA